ncbi:MAG: DNA repair protein RecN [Bacteroidales bacterium]|nr:DNA repair protein RecN [Bacteroidales bacterium]
MINNLSIRNYIIIEKLDIDFNSGFSVITGETGSGKSMIIGAISLLLGKRADTDVLFSKDKKCVIEATFDIKKLGLKDLFAENEVDYSDVTIVRREIMPEGKSRAFVNDMPVTLTVLKTLTDNFLDLHSQHENLSLTTLPYRLRIVDSAALTLPLFEEYKQQYAECQLLENLLKKKKDELAKALRDIDYYRFQAQEIENAKLVGDDEMEELETRASMLENAEEIKSALYDTSNLFDAGEYSANALLKQMRGNLTKIAKNFKPAEELENRVGSALIELSDINDTISKLLSQIEVNPQQLQLTNDRIDLLMGLMTKHRVANIAELKQKYQEYKGFVDNSGNLEDEIADLEKKFSAKEKEVGEIAKKLSAKRSASFAKTQKYIKSMLVDLGMPHAEFEIANEIIELSPNGIDNISFLFSANKSVPVQPIEKVASGGELSRLMLALKSLMADSMNIPTILFDEIDTGVSGEIAAKMGKIMQRIAQNVQVLAITHLPQVAAMGDEHFKVYKTTDDKRTVSSIMKLNNDERVTEIASMMSGEKLTQEALENAKVLLNA